jgi:hypothetical protein
MQHLSSRLMLPPEGAAFVLASLSSGLLLFALQREHHVVLLLGCLGLAMIGTGLAGLGGIGLARLLLGEPILGAMEDSSDYVKRDVFDPRDERGLVLIFSTQAMLSLVLLLGYAGFTQ